MCHLCRCQASGRRRHCMLLGDAEAVAHPLTGHPGAPFDNCLALSAFSVPSWMKGDALCSLLRHGFWRIAAFTLDPKP